MVRTARDVCLTLVTMALAVATGLAQTMPPPTAPVFGPPTALTGPIAPAACPTPVSAAAPAPGLDLTFPTRPFPAPYYTPSHAATAAPAAAPYEDRNDDLLIGDPLLDGPGGKCEIGWMGSVGVDIVSTVLHSRFNSAVLPGTLTRNSVPTVDAGAVPIDVPVASLGWTVMPRFELGYRFGQAAGEVLLRYRFLIVANSEADPGFDATGTGVNQTRVNLNIFDLDYANHESALGPLWDMKWRAGVRLLNAFSASTVSSTAASQRVTEAFTGAGPHWGLDLRRRLNIPGLSLYAGIDNSYPMGTLTQQFELLGPAGGTTRLRSPTPLTTLGLQAGLNYYLGNRLSISGGYTYEHFWDLVTFYNSSRGESIGIQGFFLRGEWKY